MRRIPRPSRAIDPAAAFQSSAARPRRLPSSCHSAIPPCTHVRTSTAAFSSTTSNYFLLPAKQDKKKHQQFVRRWQKRLLGDSEPIGAHVDPYDPTSPVRIAPEEQGEYEEVLEEETRKRGEDGDFRPEGLKGFNAGSYVPVDRKGRERPGGALLHVGGEAWLQQKAEAEKAKEFEKLTMRTYTPMTLGMANEIESLTGTPYTLRDDNLFMAQTTHDVTARPYTRNHFGLHRKPTRLEDIRVRFAQAVAEVYALKEAGLDMDLAKMPNRGIYDIPRWVRDIKLHKTASGELALVYPRFRSAEEFLRVIQSAPNWESVPIEEGEAIDEKADDLAEPVLPAETASVMDPVTPDFKRAAVVKLDPEKKPFDFMSNRPVPRSKPAESQKTQELLEVETPVAEPVSVTPSRVSDIVSAFETSQSVVSELRHAVLKQRAQRITDNLVALQALTRNIETSSPAVQTEEVKWRHAPFTDDAVKFALFKRVFQLTGIQVSDPHISSSNTIGQLYDHVYDAAKPRPTSLYSAIHIEGANARRRAKHQDNLNPLKPQRRADLGDLINLGNVQLRKTKPTKTEARTKIGLKKVLDYALQERNLLSNNLDKRRDRPLRDYKGLVEGTRYIPDFGKPLSSKGVNYLARKTMERREKEQKMKLQHQMGVKL